MTPSSGLPGCIFPSIREWSNSGLRSGDTTGAVGSCCVIRAFLCCSVELFSIADGLCCFSCFCFLFLRIALLLPPASFSWGSITLSPLSTRTRTGWICFTLSSPRMDYERHVYWGHSHVDDSTGTTVPELAALGRRGSTPPTPITDYTSANIWDIEPFLQCIRVTLGPAPARCCLVPLYIRL